MQQQSCRRSAPTLSAMAWTDAAMPQRRMPIALLTPALLGLGLVLAPQADAERLYRWVDESGNVQYSDNVPPEYVVREHIVYNEDGIALEVREPAKTPEQIAREEEIARLRAEQRRLLNEQRMQDDVLLSTFRSMDDLLMTRDGKLAGVDAQITLAQSSIERLKGRLRDLQSTAATEERLGRPVGFDLQSNIDQTRQQIQDYYAAIVRYEEQREDLQAQYQANLERFMQLRNLRIAASETEQPEQPIDRSRLVETAVGCDGPASCQRLWTRAKAYVDQHATTPLQVTGERIHMTAEPMDDDDISLTLALIPEGSSGRERVFLDIQCQNSGRGEALCEGPLVGRIRAGFRPALDGAD